MLHRISWDGRESITDAMVLSIDDRPFHGKLDHKHSSGAEPKPQFRRPGRRLVKLE
jgi:hypothetical protein